MSALKLGSDLDITGRKLIGSEIPYQWWITHTYHETGPGQARMPWWVPANCTVMKLRYRLDTAGSGGSATMGLRRAADLTAATSATALTGTVLTPAVTPSFTTLGALDLNADDLIWGWIESVNTTTAAFAAKVEMLVRRRV